jgi:DNA primase
MVVVEGPMDALAVAQVTDDVIATLTASISTAQRAFFGRWASSVIALFDMDEPGRKAATKVTAAGAQYGYAVATPSYPAHDPHDLWRTHPDLLRQLVGRSELDAILALLTRPSPTS